MELLVWATTQGRAAPSELLDGYGGKLVDRKATYSRTLEGLSDGEGLPRPSDFKIVSYSGADASVELIELAIAAGGYSRFRIDPRLPQEKFRRMYGLWIAQRQKRTGRYRPGCRAKQARCRDNLTGRHDNGF